jgi:hypothetical protein
MKLEEEEARGRTSGSTGAPAGADAAGNGLQGDELQMNASSTGNAGDNTDLQGVLEESSSRDEEQELLHPPSTRYFKWFRSSCSTFSGQEESRRGGNQEQDCIFL